MSSAAIVGVGYTEFNESSFGTANGGNATIVNNGGTSSDNGAGSTSFGYTSSAGNATLIANGGSNGGSSRQ